MTFLFICSSSLKFWVFAKSHILAHSWWDLDSHILLQFSLQISSVQKYDDQIYHHQYCHYQDESLSVNTSSLIVEHWNLFFFLILPTSVWFDFESGTHSFEDIVWCQMASNSFTIDNNSRVQVGTIIIPVFQILPQDHIINLIPIISIESLFDAILCEISKFVWLVISWHFLENVSWAFLGNSISA